MDGSIFWVPAQSDPQVRTLLRYVQNACFCRFYVFLRVFLDMSGGGVTGKGNAPVPQCKNPYKTIGNEGKAGVFAGLGEPENAKHIIKP